MVTDTQLQEWKRLTDAATPGPWRWFESGLGLRSEGVSMSSDGEVGAYAPSDEGTDVMVIDDPNVFRGLDPTADKAFIAIAREAMPALLAEVGLRTDSVHERAVAYALAAQSVAAEDVAVVQDRIRALARPPANATERMSRLSALLREAAALAGEVATDADAPAELRVAADTVHRGLVGRTVDAAVDLATLLDRVRQEYGQKAKALADQEKTAGVLPPEALDAAVDWWVALMRDQHPRLPDHVFRHFRTVLAVNLYAEAGRQRATRQARIELRMDNEPMGLLGDCMREARLPISRHAWLGMEGAKAQMVVSDGDGNVQATMGRGSPLVSVWPPDQEKTPTAPTEALREPDHTAPPRSCGYCRGKGREAPGAPPCSTCGGTGLLR